MSTILKRLFGRSEDFKALRQRGAIILDVRTAQEFRSGHIEGAINIPLDNLDQRVGELKQKNKPVIACCASGMRSGAAARMLSLGGVEAYNGGAWRTLVQKLK